MERNQTFSTVMQLLREYNRLNLGMHSILIYADQSNCIITHLCSHNKKDKKLFTSDSLVDTETWLRKQIEE
jgi:hypothetical protein